MMKDKWEVAEILFPMLNIQIWGGGVQGRQKDCLFDLFCGFCGVGVVKCQAVYLLIRKEFIWMGDMGKENHSYKQTLDVCEMFEFFWLKNVCLSNKQHDFQLDIK